MLPHPINTIRITTRDRDVIMAFQKTNQERAAVTVLGTFWKGKYCTAYICRPTHVYIVLFTFLFILSNSICIYF